MDDFAALDATGQAELVKAGSASPTELLDAALNRIDALNPELNAVIHRFDDRARDEASGDLPDGPFRGVPLLLKDLGAELAGTPFREGSQLAGDYVSSVTQELTERFLRAGFVICGKTNTPEFGILPTTEPERYGASRNPWDTSRTTGGSSGGSAAAVASAMVPVAHANDGGGSIRIPASCCGLVGMKPTRARVPTGPAYGDFMGGLVAEHVVTQSVRDSAAVLDAVAGPQVGDPYAAPENEGTYLEASGQDPVTLRIALATEAFTGESVHPDCVAGAEATARHCASLGHQVEAASFSLDQSYVEQFINLWAAGNAWVMGDWEARIGRPATPDDVEALTWALVEHGRSLHAGDYLLAVQAMQRQGRTIGAFFTDYDVLITPTLGEPPVPLGTFDAEPDNPLAGLFRSAEYVPFTPVFNVTGQPAVSLPVHHTADGLPVGVQLVGRFGDEPTLYSLAGQLERTLTWSDRWPGVSAVAG